MRLALTILLGLHGLIHLLGFFSGFEMVDFNEMNQPISRTVGLFWLLSFLLFAITIVLFFVRSNRWWLSSFLALIISQALIINHWSDAKFGTIANVIIFLATLIAYANYRFENKIKTERKALLNHSKNSSQKIIHQNHISNLPPLVQKWLTNSGMVGKPEIFTVYLTQELQLTLKPEQTQWNKGTAKQYFTVNPPAFNWNINTEMNTVLKVVGRDKFEDGKGEMLIKLLSLLPVANAKNNDKIDQGTLQRFLAEIVWFPSAALSPYIKWESMDDNSAKATMEYKGTSGSGVFHFDKKGNFTKFVAMRYRNSDDTEPAKWTVTAKKTEEINGVKIPVECEASWELENRTWTWLKLKITSIRYNQQDLNG